jgi:hypothetical protein
MKSRRSQLPVKLIAAAVITADFDSHGRSSWLKLIAVEDSRDGNETQHSKSRLKLIMARDHPEGNEIWWKTIASKFHAVDQIKAKIR